MAISSKSHQMSLEEAKAHLRGPLGNVLRQILRDTCAPIAWFAPIDGRLQHSGTVTFIESQGGVIGVTAWHVLHKYFEDLKSGAPVLMLYNARIDDLASLMIDHDEQLDVATFHIEAEVRDLIGKTITPVSTLPRVPTEGRSVMIGGYPATFTRSQAPAHNFGLFTVLGVARTVTQTQITWLYEDLLDHIDHDETGGAEIELGGLSGGPLMAAFESENGVISHSLCGIVTEAQPLRGPIDWVPPKIVAVRADFISPTGKIHRVLT